MALKPTDLQWQVRRRRTVEQHIVDRHVAETASGIQFTITVPVSWSPARIACMVRSGRYHRMFSTKSLSGAKLACVAAAANMRAPARPSAPLPPAEMP
jgi:hypothetical protein